MSAPLPAFCAPNRLARGSTDETDPLAQILTATAHTAPFLIAVFGKPGLELTFLNSRGRQWLAPGDDDALARLTLPDLFDPQERDRLHHDILLRAEVHGSWDGLCTLRDTWGSEVPVLASVAIHTPCHENPDGFISLQAMRASDPSASEIATDPHYEDKELLHALMDTLPHAVYFKDRHSRFIRVSRSLACKDGKSDTTSFIGSTDFDRFAPEHASAAYQDEQRIIATGEPLLNHEEKETWPDGRVTWVSTSKFPLLDRHNNIIGTFGISRDISDRKLAEAKNQQLEVQLQLAQKLESIGQLAAGIAHEINTPTQFISDNTRFLIESVPQLTEILALHRTLRDKVTVDAPAALVPELNAITEAEQTNELDYLLEEIPRTLEQTLEGLGRIARIVRSLKEFSHPSSPDPTPSDLNHTIATTVTISRHEWKYVATVETEFDPDLPAVPCVVDQFNQVMLNLIVNAAHAIAAAAPERPAGQLGRITVRTRRENDEAVIEVEDTGTGIPPKAQSHIFEPFFTTKEVGKGTGQGLAIVHAVIVKNHGGSINFHTTPGKGTTFTIRLPLHPPSTATPSSS